MKRVYSTGEITLEDKLLEVLHDTLNNQLKLADTDDLKNTLVSCMMNYIRDLTGLNCMLIFAKKKSTGDIVLLSFDAEPTGDCYEVKADEDGCLYIEVED